MSKNRIYYEFGDILNLEVAFRASRALVYFAMRFQSSSKKQRQIRSYAINKMGLPTVINKNEMI